jgi:hypothetical protein
VTKMLTAYDEALSHANGKQRGEIERALAMPWQAVRKLDPRYLAPWAQRAIASALRRDVKDLFSASVMQKAKI